MSDLFTAFVVLAIAGGSDLTAPAIAVVILAAFVIITAVAAIVYSETVHPVTPGPANDNVQTLIDFEDAVCDALEFNEDISPDTVTEFEWLFVASCYKSGWHHDDVAADIAIRRKLNGPNGHKF